MMTKVDLVAAKVGGTRMLIPHPSFAEARREGRDARKECSASHLHLHCMDPNSIFSLGCMVCCVLEGLVLAGL